MILYVCVRRLSETRGRNVERGMVRSCFYQNVIREKGTSCIVYDQQHRWGRMWS